MKAKNVKSVVNVNEVSEASQQGSSEQLDKANKTISELQSKLQEYEQKFQGVVASVQQEQLTAPQGDVEL
jgi:predicted translin family RNA/ssDNA-binding protein